MVLRMLDLYLFWRLGRGIQSVGMVDRGVLLPLLLGVHVGSGSRLSLSSLDRHPSSACSVQLKPIGMLDTDLNRQTIAVLEVLKLRTTLWQRPPLRMSR